MADGCAHCNGTGAGPHDKWARTDDPLCIYCGGSGRMTAVAPREHDLSATAVSDDRTSAASRPVGPYLDRATEGR